MSILSENVSIAKYIADKENSINLVKYQVGWLSTDGTKPTSLELAAGDYLIDVQDGHLWAYSTLWTDTSIVYDITGTLLIGISKGIISALNIVGGPLEAIVGSGGVSYLRGQLLFYEVYNQLINGALNFILNLKVLGNVSADYFMYVIVLSGTMKYNGTFNSASKVTSYLEGPVLGELTAFYILQDDGSGGPKLGSELAYTNVINEDTSTPRIPTANGNYSLNVTGGLSSWEAVGEAAIFSPAQDYHLPAVNDIVKSMAYVTDNGAPPSGTDSLKMENLTTNEILYYGYDTANSRFGFTFNPTIAAVFKEVYSSSAGWLAAWTWDSLTGNATVSWSPLTDLSGTNIGGVISFTDTGNLGWKVTAIDAGYHPKNFLALFEGTGLAGIMTDAVWEGHTVMEEFKQASSGVTKTYDHNLLLTISNLDRSIQAFFTGDIVSEKSDLIGSITTLQANILADVNHPYSIYGQWVEGNVQTPIIGARYDSSSAFKFTFVNDAGEGIVPRFSLMEKTINYSDIDTSLSPIYDRVTLIGGTVDA